MLHGFASSSRSAKAEFLRGRFSQMDEIRFSVPDFNPTPADFETLTVTGMINRLRQFILDNGLEDPSVVASSLGCLVGLHYAQRFGGMRRLLLLAPVLTYGSLPLKEESLSRWEKEGTAAVLHYGFRRELPLLYDFHRDGLFYRDVIPPPAPVMMLHGRNDQVIPIVYSRQYAAEFPGMVSLSEVNSDHGLLDSLELLWEHVLSFLIA